MGKKFIGSTITESKIEENSIFESKHLCHRNQVCIHNLIFSTQKNEDNLHTQNDPKYEDNLQITKSPPPKKKEEEEKTTPQMKTTPQRNPTSKIKSTQKWWFPHKWRGPQNGRTYK